MDHVLFRVCPARGDSQNPEDKKVGHPNFKLRALYMSCAYFTELSSQGPLMALTLASKHS